MSINLSGLYSIIKQTADLALTFAYIQHKQTMLYIYALGSDCHKKLQRLSKSVPLVLNAVGRDGLTTVQGLKGTATSLES